MLSHSFRYALAFSLALLPLSLPLACSEKPPSAALPPLPLRPEEKLSYAYGMDIGKRLREGVPGLDPEALAKGFLATYGGGTAQLLEEEAKKLRADHAELLRIGREADRKALADKNRSEGILFLAENKRKPGVTTTRSGLQYRVLREGKGPRSKQGEIVVVHFQQRLLDGTVLDDSRKRGTPSSLPADRVIPGWKEAVKLMPVGGLYEFAIPSHLAYGERGAGKIGPNAVLLIELELLNVEPPPPKPAPRKEAPAKKPEKAPS